MRNDMLPLSLLDIATKINAELKGDPQCMIDRVEPLAHAKAGAITFLANVSYQSYLSTTMASAVMLRAEDAQRCPTNALIVANPELAFSHLLNILFPPSLPTAGIHETARIGKDCMIDPSVSIGAYCVIGDRVHIGSHTFLAAGTTVGDDCKFGPYCRIYPRVTLYHQVKLGARVIVHSGAVLGADGFGLTHSGSGWVKMPQIGGVTIGDDAEIGANTAIDRGALQDTVIGNGVKIDNLVQIAHNVKIGDHTAIAGCTAIAGSVTIGRNCMIGGSVNISGHISLTDQVILTGTSSVGKSVTEPGVYSSGTRIEKNRVWRRNMIRFGQLDEMAKRLSRLEQQYEYYSKQSGRNGRDTDGHRGD